MVLVRPTLMRSMETSMVYKTLPGLLKHVAKNFSNPAALAHKQNGKWEKISTEEVASIVKKISLGLTALGLRKGDCVGLVADPSPFWMLFDLGVLSAGGISVPMFANIAPENLEYEISDSGMKLLFVGGDAQYKALKPWFTKVQKVITLSAHSGDDKVMGWKDLLELGQAEDVREPNAFGRLSETLNEQDMATLIYTSGSTGVPKGVQLTHRNLVSQIESVPQRFPLDPAHDIALSCLPLAHVFERMVSYFYFSTGTSLYFAEDVKKVAENAREIFPTVVTMVPRLLEKAYAKMLANAEAAPGLKKKIALAAFERARTKPLNSAQTIKDKIFDAMVYTKLRAAFGGKLKYLVSGSAPLDPQIATFFINAGFPVYEGYGLTECSPVIAANYPGNRKIGTVGRLFPTVEVKIADDGEILARGPNIMRGYWGKPEETAKTIDGQGWLHTGDLGHLDNEGFLKITGRKKELFKTANGKYVAPVPIEQALTNNKLVDMAMVIAEGRPFTTALLFPDFENMKTLKSEMGLTHLETKAFLESEPVKSSVQATVDNLNSKLNHWEQVQKWVLATTPITIDSGQLTPTMKIRRHVVAENFKPLIDAMYSAAGPG
jgi:long-chain acyl-CoA synthetase